MLVMKTVDNRLRMIRLIEKIERNRKLADQMHVKDVSEFKKQSNGTTSRKRTHKIDKF